MPFRRRQRDVEPETSQAMADLPNDRWRNFVTFYLMEAPRRGAQTNACRKAGFGKPNSPAVTAQRTANALMSDPRIQRAILEEARKLLRGAAPEAVNALLGVIRDPGHRDHARGIDMLLQRTDTVETHAVITHQVKIDHDGEAIEQLRILLRLGVARDKLEEMFGYNGLPRYLALLKERDGPPQVIEGKATEMPSRSEVPKGPSEGALTPAAKR
jgi:phage terminase small subunit